MGSPLAFRPAAPPPLTSSRYTRDFNEVKTMGSVGSTARTPDQTTYSLFWNSATATYLWNRVTLSLIESRSGDADGEGDRWDNWNRGRRHALLENARLLGQLNLAMADAAIGCRDAKYLYNYWRPITAIRDPLDDGNPGTTPDPTWVGYSRRRDIRNIRRVIRASVGRQAPYWHMSSTTASVSGWNPT